MAPSATALAFHYHALMDRAAPLTPPPFRSKSTRTPKRWRPWASAVVLSVFTAALPSHGATPATVAVPDDSSATPPVSSDMDAELFYQLLVGELELRDGEAGAAFQLMMDAARKTKHMELYRRAVEIALQARAGDSALQASRAWADAQPKSIEPLRYTLQLLVALNRPTEVAAPLRQIIRLTPADQRNELIAALPQVLSRITDKTALAKAGSQALQEATKDPATSAAAWTTLARLQLSTDQPAHALELLQRAHASDPKSPFPPLLALELADTYPSTEALLQHYLAVSDASPVQTSIRMEYARWLIDAKRYADATVQLNALTQASPIQAEAWLLQGVLDIQRNRLDAAAASVQRYLDLNEHTANSTANPRGRTQAYLLMAQIAQQQNHLQEAQGWLDKITDGEELWAVQMRRASLLARQGQLDQARALLRNVPTHSADEEKRNLMAEAQLLRDVGHYTDALEVYSQATARFPEDADLAYEQAMTAEKAGRADEMERILRGIIERQPTYAQAYNALGYSLADSNQRLPEAKTLIQKAASLSPNDPFIQDSLGWVEFRLGNLAEAQRILQAAYAKRPDAEIAAHLGEVLWSMDLHDEAIKAWRDGLRLSPDNDTLISTLKRLKVKP